MKKLAIAAAGIALLAAAGWSGLWFVGRGQVAERFGLEIALLGARGIEVTYGGREIGGFPFGYRVTLSDVTVREPVSGALYRLPELITEVTADDIDRLVIRFPAKFTIDLPLAAMQGAGTQGEPVILNIDFEAQDLVVVTDGLPGSGQEIAVTAQSLLFAMGGEAQPLNLAVEFTDLESRATLPAAEGGAPATGTTTIGGLDYIYAGTTSAGVDFTIQGAIDNLRLTGHSDIRGQAGILALFEDARGTTAMTYQTSANRISIRSVTGPEPRGGTLTVTAGSTAGTFSIANGMIEIASSSRANSLTLFPEPVTAGGQGLNATLRTIEAIYQAPFAPGEAMAPFTLRLALDELTPSDTLWQLLDDAGILPRDPARLVVDIEGTGRITKSMAEMRPGEAMPVEIGNVSVRALDLTALGASITTRGEVEFLQPINLPLGNLTVTLENVMQTIAKLVEAGLLTPEQSNAAALLAAIYTSPGDAPGKLISKVAMTVEGITVNGQPVDPGR